MNLPLSDRIKFIVKSIIKNGSILAILFAFFLFGCLAIFIATKMENAIGLYILGGAFISMSLLTFSFTMPSSLAYHYSKALIKKYGCNSTATIIHKEIEDTSYTDSDMEGAGQFVEEITYFLTYSFTYLGKKIENSFYVDTENYFNTLEIGDTVPIKFLKTKPEKSAVRMRKLANELNLKDLGKTASPSVKPAGINVSD